MPRPPPRSLMALLWVIAITTGMVDAVSVLGFGHVFTAFVTGDFVFVGLGLAGVHGFSIARSLAAVAAFVVGAALGGRIGRALEDRRRAWMMATTMIQAALVGLAAVSATGYDQAAFAPLPQLYAMIALVAGAMGLRNATTRHLGIADMTTSPLTTTLTGLGAESSFAGGHNPRWPRRLLSVAAIVIGALIGGAMTMRLGVMWPLAVVAATTLCAGVAYAAVGERG